jgi:hypothetical protein
MNTARTGTQPAKPTSVGFESIRQIIERARAAEARQIEVARIIEAEVAAGHVR